MVAAADQLAAGAGVEMLARGGSAADAAVAAGTVMAVVGPHLCGMGGDVLAMVSEAGAAPVALLSVGRAGAGSDAAALRSAGHATMPLRGQLGSVPVPGAVDGWLALHARYGRLPLDEVLGPAVALAEDGFCASVMLALATHLVHRCPGRANCARTARWTSANGCACPASPGRCAPWRPGDATRSTAASSGAGCARWAAATSPRTTSRSRWPSGASRCMHRRGGTSCGRCRRRRRGTSRWRGHASPRRSGWPTTPTTRSGRTSPWSRRGPPGSTGRTCSSTGRTGRRWSLRRGWTRPRRGCTRGGRLGPT